MPSSDIPYDSYPTPDHVPVLESEPLDLSSEDQQAIRDLVATSPLAVRAAHLYERKGFFATDDFAQEKRNSYGDPSDDFVVQVTLFIPHDHAHREKAETLTGIHRRVQETQAQAEIAARQNEIAARQAEVAQAEADLAAAQARLDALRHG